MKNIGFVLTLFFLHLNSNAQDAKEIAKEALNSTLSIVALDKTLQPLAYGSGFVIDGGYVVTNVHVIEGSNSVYILKNNSQQKYDIEGYVAIDRVNDLVIVKPQNFYCASISLADTALPEIGERIYAVGNPKGLSGTFSEGIVSGVRNVGTNQVIQITAPISPGSSGGPVLNSQAEVVGIAFASFTEGQNLNFAIPVKYLNRLEKKIGDVLSVSNVKPVSKEQKPNSNIGANIKDGVTIRNIEPCRSGGPSMPDYLAYSEASKVHFQCSIKNNLPQKINRIRILFLSFDNTGTVIDYTENTFSMGGIAPLLAKTTSCESTSHYYDYAPYLTYKYGYKVKARVLDFEIEE